MTSLEKLIRLIQARPPQARFSDVPALLEASGWRLDREKGSHVVYIKEGERAIVVPKAGGRWVKRVYLDQIAERLGLDD
jgi:predicted RNA binding protein YcfA (HicA-like mRNA interferase family)